MGAVSSSPSDIAVDISGNVVVTGTRYDDPIVSSYATIKYNSSGVQQWVARYSGTTNGPHEAIDLKLDGTGNIYVTGK